MILSVKIVWVIVLGLIQFKIYSTINPRIAVFASFIEDVYRSWIMLCGSQFCLLKAFLVFKMYTAPSNSFLYVFLGKIGQIDSSVVRSLKKMTVNQDQEMESRIFAPLWGGPANVAALERNIKHR